jgi:hypothetical protein
MTDTPTHPTPPDATPDQPPADVAPITDADELETRLQDICDLLKHQQVLLEQENYDAFDAACVKLAPELQAVTAARCHITDQAFACMEEIRKLHHNIGLKLCDRSAATAKALDRVRAGKNMVKAYNS